MASIRNQLCVAFLVAVSLIGSAVAQQRTGRVDIICSPLSGSGNKIAFTLDYDLKQVLGFSSQMTLIEWSDETIHWQLRSSLIRYYFVRKTGDLGYFDFNGDSHRYTCRRATANDGF